MHECLGCPRHTCGCARGLSYAVSKVKQGRRRSPRVGGAKVRNHVQLAAAVTPTLHPGFSQVGLSRKAITTLRFHLSLWADSNQLRVGSAVWGLRSCEPHKVLHNECSAHTRSALLQHQATSARREGTTFTFRCLDYLLLSPQGIFKFAASLHHSIVGALTSQDLRRARHRRSQRQSLFGEPTIEKWTPLIINARTQIQLVLELHAAWTCT